MRPRIALLGLAILSTSCSHPAPVRGVCPAYPVMSDAAKQELGVSCMEPESGRWRPQCTMLGDWFAEIAVLRKQLATCG